MIFEVGKTYKAVNGTLFTIVSIGDTGMKASLGGVSFSFFSSGECVGLSDLDLIEEWNVERVLC